VSGRTRRSLRAVSQWGRARQGSGRTPSLDLELRRLSRDQFAELLGRAIGAGFLWLAAGSLLMAFTSGRFAAGGFSLGTLGLFQIAGGIAAAVAMRKSFRPPRGWRRAAIALAIGAVPIGYLWLSLPVQHWAGVRLPGWEWILAVVTGLFLALMGVPRLVLEFSALRLPSPAGEEAGSLAWIDAHVNYLESLRRMRQTRPSSRRKATRTLGHFRVRRFEHPAGGQIADLHEAVELFGQVKEQTRPGDRDEPGAYHDLATAMWMRAALEQRGDDLDAALDLMQRIRTADFAAKLSLYERDSLQRWTDELTLLRVLTYRRLELTSPAQQDTDEAGAEALRDLAQLASSADRPDWFRARVLMTIAEFHLLWFSSMSGERAVSAGEALAHLDEAIEHARSAAALPAAGSGPVLNSRTVLALALARRVRLRIRGLAPAEGADEDHDAAKSNVRAALAQPSLSKRRSIEGLPAGVVWTLLAASHCMDVDLGRGRWQEVINIGEPALRALTELVSTTIFRHDREEGLLVGKGLHEKLAYAIAMLHASRPRARLDMIGLIEGGRAVLLREALGRSVLADVADRLTASGRGELAADVRRLLVRAAELDAIELRAHDAAGRAVRRERDSAGNPLRDAMVKARTDWAELRVKVDRALAPGAGDGGHGVVAFERDLAAAAAPLCYLLHMSRGADGAGPDLPGLAIVVSAASERTISTEVLPLPSLTSEAVLGWLQHWNPTIDQDGQSTGQTTVAGLLRELGEQIMDPVFTAAARPGRLVLLPDGLLAMLPLHAATFADPAGMPRPLCDQAVVSYTPTVLVLRSCQAGAAEMDARCEGRLPAHLTGVADPGGGPGGALPGAIPELKAAAGYFATAELITAGATPETVRAAIAANASSGSVSVVHFACHARAEIRDPLSSHIQLGPGPAGRLKLADLLGTGLGDTRLAVLSACETGVLGTDDPDQYVSLATGFIQIGAVGVVGTMSAVYDTAAVALIASFYQEWARQPGDPAAALSAAQRSLMADPRFAHHPGYWAPFYFLGA